VLERITLGVFTSTRFGVTLLVGAEIFEISALSGVQADIDGHSGSRVRTDTGGGLVDVLGDALGSANGFGGTSLSRKTFETFRNFSPCGLLDHCNFLKLFFRVVQQHGYLVIPALF
jgi:hypothetical protein